MIKFIKVFKEYINVNNVSIIAFDEELCKIYCTNGKVITIRVNELIPNNAEAKETIESIKRFLEKNLI